MARRCDVKPAKTYATEENLEAAIKKLELPESLRYHVAWTKHGRCYAIFAGTDPLAYGVHFHFPILG